MNATLDSPTVGGPSSKQLVAGKPVVELSYDYMSRFKPARVFRNAVEKSAPKPDASEKGHLQVTSIAFDDTGDRCLTAGEDDVFTLYDAKKGVKLRSLYSKKYGIAHARFAHRRENIIHASTKGDHDVRYHSMHDNKYLSYFQGHTGTVRSLQMNPVDDTFLSSGDDGTVRLWDLRTPTCRGLVNDIGGPAISAFDSSGVVFAVACSTLQTIMLFDSTSLDDAPFSHSAIIDVALQNGGAPAPQFTSLSFSNNGDYILLGTASGVHYVLDAYDLSILRRLEGHQQGLGRLSGEEVCWTSDSHWVLSGSPDGSIAVWDLTAPNGQTKLEPLSGPNEPAPTLKPTTVLRPSNEAPVPASRAVQFNPRYGMLAVGGEDLAFWLPARTDEEMEVEEGS